MVARPDFHLPAAAQRFAHVDQHLVVGFEPLAPHLEAIGVAVGVEPVEAVGGASWASLPASA